MSLVEIESANKAHATKLSYKASTRRHVHNSLDIITREEENLVVTKYLLIFKNITRTQGD